MIWDNEIINILIAELEGNMTIKLLTENDSLDNVNERLEDHGYGVHSPQYSWLTMSS